MNNESKTENRMVRGSKGFRKLEEKSHSIQMENFQGSLQEDIVVALHWQKLEAMNCNLGKKGHFPKSLFVVRFVLKVH